MGFTVGLEYYDGNTTLGRPVEATIDALPPIGAVMWVQAQDYTVHQVRIDLHEDGTTSSTLQLKAESIN